MRQRSLLLLLLGALPACYVNTPVDASVRPMSAGENIALDISDLGRVGLAERFGPGVVQIEGRLRAATERAYELSVFRVSYLRDGDSRWAGERVVVEREHVGRVYERKLSRTRTLMAAGAVAGSLVVFAITRALVSEGREPDDPPEPPGPISTRVPHVQVIH